MKTSPKRYKDIDWERVIQVLRLRAFQLFWTGERVIDAATADDLVQEVVIEFLNHPSGMGWDPKQGPLERLLRVVLERRWVDHLRRRKKIAVSLGDDENLMELAAKPDNPLAELEYQSFLATIKQRVQDVPDLLELIEAADLLDDDCPHVNKELAELIGTSVADIENRKKRLRRLFTGFPHET